MRIWVDADACPHVIKEVLFRAADRAHVPTTLISAVSLRTPPSPFITTVQVAKGPAQADDRIMQDVQPGDLVITAHLRLAAAVVARGAQALAPRGELYSEDNVHERLAMGNLVQALRTGGALPGSPAPFRPGDRQRFEAELDHWLTRSRKAVIQR